MSSEKKRIGSIDALRAFALLGIITVHAIGRFCIPSSFFTAGIIDKLMLIINGALLENRCATIFALLFGVSFYIILKKPSYPTSKFVWRCFLLMCIGIFNKMFYRADALMIYGICGMILASFRKLTNKQLLLTALLLYIGGYTMSIASLWEYVTPYMTADVVRYKPGHTFCDVMAYWPQSVLWYIEHTLHGGLMTVLAKFTLGYWVGRTGFVEKMDETISLKTSIVLGTVYAISIALEECVDYFSDALLPLFVIKQLKVLLGASFYSIGFVWIYNHCKGLSSLFHHMENYGKLGLTNYTCQGIFMVLLLCDFGLGYRLNHIYNVVLVSWLFYCVQLLFSTWWLSKFRNGPLEYLWRCATNLEWLQLRK